MENNIPFTLNIRELDKKDYNLLKDKDSPFVEKGNKELFMMAMIVGFRDGTRLKLDKKETFVRIEYLSPKEKSVIKAIAVAEERNLDILLNKIKVYSIAEEYAAGGIKLLKERIFSKDPGSYIKKLESDLVAAFKKTNL